jgi:hypothetical protein
MKFNLIWKKFLSQKLKIHHLSKTNHKVSKPQKELLINKRIKKKGRKIVRTQLIMKLKVKNLPIKKRKTKRKRRSKKLSMKQYRRIKQ